jgi:hypothetical protein
MSAYIQLPMNLVGLFVRYEFFVGHIRAHAPSKFPANFAIFCQLVQIRSVPRINRGRLLPTTDSYPNKLPYGTSWYNLTYGKYHLQERGKATGGTTLGRPIRAGLSCLTSLWPWVTPQYPRYRTPLLAHLNFCAHGERAKRVQIAPFLVRSSSAPSRSRGLHAP